MAKRIVTWGGVAFLLFFIALRPDSAADAFASLGGVVADIWDGLVGLIKSLGA